MRLLDGILAFGVTERPGPCIADLERGLEIALLVDGVGECGRAGDIGGRGVVRVLDGVLKGVEDVELGVDMNAAAN